MSAKKICLGGLVVILLGLGAARGQGPAGSPYSSANGMGEPAGPSAPPSTQGPPPPAMPPGTPPMLSDWVAGCRGPLCAGPIGANGPIYQEPFVRSGLVWAVSGNLYGRALETGWNIEVGDRTLFFNPEATAAWTAELSLANFNNTSGDRTTLHPLFNVPITRNGQTTVLNQASAAIKSLNRTTVNVAGGREWYLWGTAECGRCDPNLRVGFDVGGRYGTAKNDFFNPMQPLPHRTDTIGGVFVSAHTDLEVPMGGCILVAGVRGEWGYTWSDILQEQNNSDVEDLNLLFTFGARF
jgi:hypothetical protein